jgi:predicted nicotinamide N-methyase
MPLELISPWIEHHPIASLDYELVTGLWSIGDRTFKLTTLSDVELSIDRVFEWLDTVGRQADEIEQLAPYFGVVWPAALALGGYLAQSEVQRRIHGKKVIELGCGLAIPSMLCSRYGAACTVVDSHPNVPAFLRRNLAQNEPCSLRFASQQDLHGLNDQYDWILASDVLYEPGLTKVFAQMITDVAKPQSRCVVTDPGRVYCQEFVHEMNRLGWNDHLEPWSVPHKGRTNDVFVMVFNRRDTN